MQSKGVVVENTPNGDQILMGEAANQESLASDPRGPANAARSARLLYRRLSRCSPRRRWPRRPPGEPPTIYGKSRRPTPPTAPPPTRKEAYLRDQMDEDELHKCSSTTPNTKWARLRRLRAD